MMISAGIAMRNHGIVDPETGGVGVVDIGGVSYKHCASDVQASPAMPKVFVQLLLTQLL